MGCKGVVLGLFLLSFSFAYAEVVINEVMYDPDLCSDTYCEWFELYNNESYTISLENWTVCGISLLKGYINNSNGVLYSNNSFKLPPNSFALITDGGSGTQVYNYFNVSNSSLAFRVNGSSICGGLSDNDTIFIDDNTRIAILNYDSSQGGKNGHTLCLFNSIWQECLATPGGENKINVGVPLNDTNTTTTNIKLSAYLSSPTYVGNIYNNLFKLTVEEKDNCSAKDTILVGYNISTENYFSSDTFIKEIGCSSYASTGEFIPSSAGSYVLCGWIINSTINEKDFSDNSVCFNVIATDVSSVPCEVGLDISLDDTPIYKQGESLSYAFALSNETFPFTVEYWIEDIFGKMVKSKYNTTNTNSKTWKADISEEDRVLYLKAQLYPSCKDQNLSDNHAQKMFIVTNEGALQTINNTNNTNSTDNTSSADSEINITKITPAELDWGEALRAEVEIYKGNTGKYAVYAWVEIDGSEVSEVTKINLYSKYTHYKLALPLLLDSRCEEEGQDAVLVVEGLDQRAEQEVTIVESSSDCDEEEMGSTPSNYEEKSYVDTATADSGDEDVSFELLDFPARISPGQTLNFKVKFKGDEWDHFFQTYSYVYRGSRCYSCELETKEREDYLQEFFLGFEEEKAVDYSLPLDGEIEPGNYKLKVRVHKDGQITAKSVDANLTIGEEKAEKSLAVAASTLSKKGSNTESSSWGVQRTILNQSYFLVYESSNEKAKKLIPYLLILVLGLLCVILMKEKRVKR